MSRSRLDLDYLIGVLSRRGLISERQAKVISQKAPAQKEKLTQLCKVKRGGLSSLRCGDEVTSVDVLASMGLKLGKGANGRLNEEAIMRMVAADLGMTFKKIDPLKLDLELVTQTIPKSFALKHMVLPVESSLETITVAVYDPWFWRTSSELPKSGWKLSSAPRVTLSKPSLSFTGSRAQLLPLTLS